MFLEALFEEIKFVDHTHQVVAQYYQVKNRKLEEFD